MASQIDLKELQAFQLIARLGTMRGAAAQLGLTVPAVSIRLKRLEDDLGVALFERAGKRLLLTRAGELFLSKSGQVFEALNNAVGVVSGKIVSRERIAIAIVNHLAFHFAGPITGFLQQRKDVDLALRVRRTQEILAMVLDNEANLGIGYLDRVPAELNKITVAQSGFSLLCHKSHPLAKRKTVRLAELGEHRLIGPRPESPWGRRIGRAFKSAGLPEPPLIEGGNCTASLDFAACNLGVAIVHTACLRQTLPRSLCRLDATAHFGTVDIAVVHRRRHHLSAVQRELLDLVSLRSDMAR